MKKTINPPIAHSSAVSPYKLLAVSVFGVVFAAEVVRNKCWKIENLPRTTTNVLPFSPRYYSSRVYGTCYSRILLCSRLFLWAFWENVMPVLLLVVNAYGVGR